MTHPSPSPEIFSACSHLRDALGLPALPIGCLPRKAIIVDDRPGRAEHQAFEEAMRGTGGRVVPVLLEPEAITVGPVSRVGTPCSQCAAKRRAARAENPTVTSAMTEHMDALPEGLHDGVNAALFQEVLVLAQRAQQLNEAGYVWVRDHARGNWAKEALLPVWSCSHFMTEPYRPKPVTLSLGSASHV